MELSPADSARLAEIDLRREEMWRESQQDTQRIADKSMAWGVAGTLTNLEVHNIGKQGVAAFDWMTQWVKVFKSDERGAFLDTPDPTPAQMNTIQFDNNVGAYDSQAALGDLNDMDGDL